MPRKKGEAKPKPKPKPHVKAKRELAERLLKKPINWPREMNIANKLFEELDDVEFWKSVSLDFKLNSLAYFLTGDGRKVVENKQRAIKFEMPERETYTLEDEKVGEDKVILKKPKSLKEFIKQAQNG